MAYLHCHKCGWGQDDFWSMDGYNPFRQDMMDDYKQYLFKEKVMFCKCEFVEWLGSYDTYLPNDKIIQEGELFGVSGKDFVAIEMLRRAKRILNMEVKTWEEWEAVKDEWKCPKCGSTDWDID